MEQVEAGLVRGEPRPLDLQAAERPHGNVAIRFPAPGTAPVLEPQHLFRGLLHEGLHRDLIAEPISPRDGVVVVLVEAVPWLDHRRRAALRRDRVSAHRIHLVDYGYLKVRGLFDDYGHPANASTSATDDH